MGFFGFSRIRSVHPSHLEEAQLPSDSVEEPQVAPELPARREPQVPVMHEEVLGIHRSQFPSVPTAVWNHLVGAVRSGLQALGQRIETAYENGLEEALPAMLDQAIPEEVYCLGRDVMHSVLSHERGFLGSRLRCDVCNNFLDYEGDKVRTVTTRLGDVTYSRSYYHGACGHTVFPLDALLGIGKHGMLPQIQEIVSRETSERPFATAVKSIERMLPIHLSTHTAERVTETMARVVHKEQELERRQAFSNPSDAQFPITEAQPNGSVAAVAVDGGYCKIRGQKECREFKLAVLGVVEPKPATGEPHKPPPVRDKSYVAHIANADSIFEYLQLEYQRKGLQHCKTLHFLGDGAEWIWNRAAVLRAPGQEMILTLDYFHADEYLNKAANVAYTPGTPERTAWYEKIRGHLWEDEHDAFFRELTTLQAAKAQTDTVVTDDSPSKVLADVHRYFEVRRHLLNYKACRERGLLIGSGMVEGGIRFVGKDRLDRTGMKWNVEGADNILQLRCLDASNRWDQFYKKQALARAEDFRLRKSAWLRAA